MKKVITLILAAILILSTATFSYGAGFSDIKSTNWAYAAVNAMSNKSIISGYPDGSFKPNNTVTYGEFIKMALIAATGEDVGNAESGNWASNYYNKALELKYFTAYDIDKSQLKFQITRAHMALIISSILGDVDIENYDEIQKGITDITYKTEYEYDITKAYAYGILTGYTDNTIRPDKTLTRAESATVIYRLVDESKRIYPETETETENKVDVKVGDKIFSFYLEKVKLGYNGIEKIEVNTLGRIVIYSNVCYDAVSVYIDNTQVSAMGFTSGLNYYKEGKYYIYLANPAKNSINPAGEIPSLTFSQTSSDSPDTIYRYTDVTL